MIWTVVTRVALAGGLQDESGVDDVSAPLLPESAGIINGEPAVEGDYPMTGAMLMSATWVYNSHSANFSTLVCSSTLIAPDTVLLAAHCLDDDAITLGMGELSNKVLHWTRQADLTEWDGTESSPDLPLDAIAVTASVKHPDFSLRNMGLELHLNNDIGILFLEEPLLDVPVAYLPTADEAVQIESGLGVEIVGWGMQVAPESMYELPAPGTYATKQMGASWLGAVAEFELQVGPDIADVRKCHGDSGGPTFLHVETTTDDSMRLIGVTSHSWDNTDCMETGGVDTRVDYFLDWIDTEMRARCADGTRSWCEEEGILVAPTTEIVDDDTGDAVADDGGEEPRGGCGCGTPTMAGPFALLIAGLTALRRRRLL